MGLAERRAVKHFTDHVLPGLQAAIDKAAGCPVAIEVEWDTLAEDGMSHMYEEAFTKVYFAPLEQAMAAIAIDDMGREALAEGLKAVRVRNVNNISSFRGFTFKDGVLTIDHKPTTNIDSVQERVEGLVKLLEAGL